MKAGASTYTTEGKRIWEKEEEIIADLRALLDFFLYLSKVRFIEECTKEEKCEIATESGNAL